MSLTPTLMAAKKAKGMSFADLANLLGLDEVWIASLFYGQSTASAEEASKLGAALDLPPAVVDALQAYPTKGSLDPVIPTDPLIYRFYEIMQVTLEVDKVEDPKGDRVKVTMCGKFLPYKKW